MLVKDGDSPWQNPKEKYQTKKNKAMNKEIELRKHDVVNSPKPGVKCIPPVPFWGHSSHLFDLRDIYLAQPSAEKQKNER